MCPAPVLDGLPAALLAWHDPSARRLSWRTTNDPYAVLVSEIMAQQTQAERAAQAWTGFMGRFPTVQDLAAAQPGEVIQAWQGLGYNRRAVNLHRCAKVIATQHAGRVPNDLKTLLGLPGIGPYTARAVLVFAFGQDVVPVDTNIARVLARVTARVLTRPAAQVLADMIGEVPVACLGSPGFLGSDSGGARVDTRGVGQNPGTPAVGLEGARVYTRQVGQNPGTPRDVGSSDAPAPAARLAAALMDLGATVCTAKRPSCQTCPLLTHCRWTGSDEPDPAAHGDHRPRPQSRFAGSARQARGRVIDALRGGPIPAEHALVLAGTHGEVLLDGLVADGLAERTPRGLALPGWSG